MLKKSKLDLISQMAKQLIKKQKSTYGENYSTFLKSKLLLTKWDIFENSSWKSDFSFESKSFKLDVENRTSKKKFWPNKLASQK